MAVNMYVRPDKALKAFTAGLPTSGADEAVTTTAAPASPGLEQMLAEREAWLNNQFGNYLGSVRGASSEYGGLLGNLLKKLAANSEMNIGITGGPSMTFTPGRIIDKLTSLGQMKQANDLLAPSAQWAWQQQNPIHTGATSFLDYLSGIAGASEQRRYGTPSSTESGSISANASPLTTIGAIGNLMQTGHNIYDQGQTKGWW